MSLNRPTLAAAARLQTERENMELLTKSDLVAEVARRTKSSKAATDRFVTALQEVVMEAVVEGKEVKLTGFAAFSSVDREAKTMKNPKTGEPVEVPATRLAKIKPLGEFKDRLAKN